MTDFAEAHLRLSASTGHKDRDGHDITVREETEARLKRARTKEKREEIEAELYGPPLPPAMSYLWRIFQRIRSRKGSNGFSANPIEGADVESFERRFRIRLMPWEHEVIDDLDNLYMAQQAKNARPGNVPEKPPPKPAASAGKGK